mgnify:CR=1 FL=1
MNEQKRYVRVYYKPHRDGRSSYLQGWSGIGPYFTQDPEKAMTFATKEEADAQTFPLAPMKTKVQP